MLTHCKQSREVLVVGLNSDESVVKLGRATFASCEERARAIAQLRGIDLIVAYDEEPPTPSTIWYAGLQAALS